MNLKREDFIIMFDFLLGLGIIGVILLILILLLVPFIITVLVGIGFANFFGFTGFTWWAFVILFYLLVGTILTKCSK